MQTHLERLSDEARLWPLTWLTDMSNAPGSELQRRLRLTLTASMMPMILGCANTATVTLIAYFRSGNSIFLWFALLDLALIALRGAIRLPRFRPWHTDGVFLCGTLWAATNAASTLMISLGSDMPMIILVTASAFGSCAGIISNNFVAPRYAMMQILMIDAAFKISFATRVPEFIPLLVPQAVIFIAGLNWIMHRQRDTTLRAISAEIENRNHALSDPLTGVLNRRGLQARAEAMMTENQSLQLFCLDLDGFKTVNDRYGHAVGDDVLKMAAERLRDCLPDAAICRLGGDEFLVLTASLDRRAAETMASRIIIALSTPYPVAGTVVRIGVSVGLSDVAADHGDLTQSMLSADQALYRAKASGKGRFVSAEDMPIGLAGTA